MKKVLSYSFHSPMRSGVADYVCELNTQIRAHGQSIVDVHTFFWNLYTTVSFVTSLIPFSKVRWYAMKVFTLFLSLFYTKQSGDVHVFHLSNHPANYVLLSRYFNTKGKKILVLHERFSTQWLRDEHDQEQQQRVLVSADVIVVHTKVLQEWVEGFGFEALHIPLGTQLYDMMSTDEIKKELSLSGTVIAHLGFVEKSKGIDMLIPALSSLPSATFVCVGAGSYLSEIQKELKDTGIHFQCTGYVSGEIFRKYLLAADVVVIPRMETLGECSAVMIQAMAAGKIIVANNIDCFREYLGSERGILVNGSFEEGLARALLPSAYVYGMNAHTFAKSHLVFSVVVPKYLKIIS